MPAGLYGVPRRSGKLKDLSKFDAAFFGVHPKQAHTMDPQLRLMMEVSYEAIVDAGINPASLRGTQTGVWVGISGSEAAEAVSRDPETLVGYGMVGCQRAMMANRLSFFFDFKGGCPLGASPPLGRPQAPGSRPHPAFCLQGPAFPWTRPARPACWPCTAPPRPSAVASARQRWWAASTCCSSRRRPCSS